MLNKYSTVYWKIWMVSLASVGILGSLTLAYGPWNCKLTNPKVEHLEIADKALKVSSYPLYATRMISIDWKCFSLFLLKSFLGRMWQPLLAPNRQIFFNVMSKEFFCNLKKSLYRVLGLTVLCTTQKSQWQFVSHKSFSLHSFI